MKRRWFRPVAWSVSLVALDVAAGPVGFLGTKTCVPLWAILMMVFLPAEAFIDLARSYVPQRRA